jgi:nicotinamide-nucleotide amidase
MSDAAANLLAALEARGLKLAIAESLTGGALAAELVSVAGASRVLLGSIVAYHSDLKSSLIGVSRTLIENEGVINAEVAVQMAQSVRERMAEGCGITVESVVGLSTTGVAGPDSQDGQPPGTVFVGLAVSHNGLDDLRVFALVLAGDRQAIRSQTVSAAVEALAEYLSE